MEEWILVVLPESEAGPTRVTRKHYELNLKAKGFKIHGEKGKPAKRGKAETKEEESS